MILIILMILGAILSLLPKFLKKTILSQIPAVLNIKK